MATSSKENDEFFALAMVCSSILESVKPAKSDHPIYPRLSGKSFIGQMGKTNFAPFTQNGFWAAAIGKQPGSSCCSKPGRMHPAIHGPLGARVALLQSPILPAPDHDRAQ